MVSIRIAPRVCPICGTTAASRPFAAANVALDRLDGFAFASRKRPEYMHWRLAECRRCDLLYVDLAPAADDLAALYRDAAFASGAEAAHASRTYARWLPEIVARLPDRAAAADVGTGDGAFLKALLAAGFRDVVGIEPSAAPIAAADPAVRPLIRHTPFAPTTFAAGSLTLLTCFQTLEHLADPLGFTRAAHQALRPGGALFLIGHDRRAFAARLLGRTSPIFDVEHLQLFSPASVRRLLETAGFAAAAVAVRPIANRYPLRYWTQLFPFPGPLKSALLAALEATAAGRIMVPLPAGNLAAIAYKQAETPLASGGSAAEKAAGEGESEDGSTTRG
jgi:SAM-dependent methyltransferase